MEAALDSGSVRKKNIDIARGIAIICIVLGHLNVPQINRIVFTFHVPLFFIISGYFFNDQISFGKLLNKKARTLLCPYYLTCFTIISAVVIRSLIRHKGGTVNKVKDLLYATLYAAGDKYTEPFYIASIGAIWFLWAMFWAECMLYFVLKVKPEIRFLVIAAVFAAGYYSRQLFWFPLSIQAGCSALLFVYIGYLVRKMEGPYKNSGNEVKYMISFGAAIIWICFMRDFVSFWLVHCDIGRGMIDVFGSLCGCLCVIHIAGYIDRIKYVSDFLAFLGKYSIFMLCAHIFELKVFRWGKIKDYLSAKGFEGLSQLLLVITIKLLWCIIITYIFSRSDFICKLMGVKRMKVSDSNKS